MVRAKHSGASKLIGKPIYQTTLGNVAKTTHQFISILAKVLRKLAAYDPSNDLAIHVALDNTIVIDDAKEAAASAERKEWRPLLLVVPLRLGLTDINPIYFPDLKVRAECFSTLRNS